MVPPDQTTLTFPDELFVMINARGLVAEINKRKKIYNKHKFKMKALHPQIPLRNPARAVAVVEHPWLEKTAVIFDRDKNCIYVGDVYAFLFWYYSASGGTLDDAAAACIEYAKGKINRAIDLFIEIRQSVFNRAEVWIDGQKKEVEPYIYRERNPDR